MERARLAENGDFDGQDQSSEDGGVRDTAEFADLITLDDIKMGPAHVACKLCTEAGLNARARTPARRTDKSSATRHSRALSRSISRVPVNHANRKKHSDADNDPPDPNPRSV